MSKCSNARLGSQLWGGTKGAEGGVLLRGGISKTKDGCNFNKP